MKKILIYYGPKNGFESEVSAQRITLTELLRDSEFKRNMLRVITNPDEEIQNKDKEIISNLVIYSEEYAGLSESGLQNFISILELYNIQNLYMQNPPLQIHQKFETSYGKVLKVKKYTYNSITKDRFLKIYEEFSESIIGQDSVRDKILGAFYPLLKSDENKPLVIMLYGKSGVGKTETAKFISNILDQKLFRKQFSMFQNQEFSTYLFGGNNSQNCLAKDLLERESNVILLDEFDKANPVFYTAFYQLFDEGIFEDKNYRVDLNNAIIICTSNYEDEKDIMNHLGAPIFYRFHKLIKFNELGNIDKINLIERVLKNKYSKLDKDEQQCLDVEYLRNTLKQNISKIHNVRQISNFIEDYINSELVENYIMRHTK